MNTTLNLAIELNLVAANLDTTESETIRVITIDELSMVGGGTDIPIFG